MTVRSFGEIFEWRNDVTYPSRGARTIGADAALTKGLIERVWPRANVDARSPSILHEHGPIKRITRLMLDCKIERAKRKGARELAAKDGGGGEREREREKAYLSRRIDLLRGKARHVSRALRNRSARCNETGVIE